MIEENPENRAFLLKVFGKEWMIRRDEFFKELIKPVKPIQLKLEF